jgi:hypothetical protein
MEAVNAVFSCTFRNQVMASSSTIWPGVVEPAGYDHQMGRWGLGDSMSDSEQQAAAFRVDRSHFLADEAHFRTRKAQHPKGRPHRGRSRPDREGAQSVGASRRSLLLRRILRFRVVWIFFVRFMMADDAPDGRAQLAMSRHVVGDAADDGSLDAPLGICRGRESQRNRGGTSRDHHPFHVRSPVLTDPEINAMPLKSVLAQ